VRQTCAGWRIVVVFLVQALATPASAQSQCPYDWLPGEGMPGTDGFVRAITVLDCETGPVVYVGGNFAVAGNVLASKIAEWNPAAQSWSAMGTGLGDSPYARVGALATLKGRLYVGGDFTTAGGVSANGLAVWDPATRSWSAMGTGLSGQNGGSTCAFAVLDGKLYAGGYFTAADGVSANNIACWDPATQTWSALGTGVNGTVVALAVLSGRLYVAGSFSSAGGASIARTACWDPASQTWSALGLGVGGLMPYVRALAAMGGRLYVGGFFETAGGVAANSVACWDPATQAWSALGTGLDLYNREVDALAALDDQLYVGGNFGTAGGVSASCIACWNATTQNWSPLGVGIPILEPVLDNADVLSLAVLRGRVYAGGAFKTIGEIGADNAACWDPAEQTWSACGSGTNAAMTAVAVLDGALYVAGDFATVGGVNARGVAGWSPATHVWSALSTGVDEDYAFVFSLAALDGKLYAAGWFTTIGGVIARSVAAWDPGSQTWSALGSGLGGVEYPSVSALATLDGRLYVAGEFTTAGGVIVEHVACWDPVTGDWSALGSGVIGTYSPPYVHAMAAGHDRLYVGGTFTTAGGADANYIACWDPSTQAWSPLGAGMNGDVVALAVLDGKVYAAGAFTTAGNINAYRVACWNPATETWSALGWEEGWNWVSALTVLDGKLYAGGSFHSAGWVAANNIASWDPVGHTWSALGVGAGRDGTEVRALAAWDGVLYVGGEFTAAGGQVSAFVGRWGRTLHDLDADGDVNLDDWVVFASCLDDPEGPNGPGCACADTDLDGDIDLADYATFQRAFTTGL
jgi:trimeric autotransporter adhesin